MYTLLTKSFMIYRIVACCLNPYNSQSDMRIHFSKVILHICNKECIRKLRLRKFYFVFSYISKLVVYGQDHVMRELRTSGTLTYSNLQ